jgi:hypothetical protein
MESWSHATRKIYKHVLLCTVNDSEFVILLASSCNNAKVGEVTTMNVESSLSD